MALLKCKMCGGSLEVSAGETIIECEYCGTQQTLPKTTDENIQSLFNRANLLRQKNEFDKAEAVYEKILEADDTEAEAYWGIILCKFGVEYVEDPKTYKRIPTCHRTSYDSIVADEYYKKALENADITQRSIYEAEAKKIDEIQKGILAISAQEEPYDVFICYKETDESGKRTQDSVIANDIYYQLTQEGFKVFYAAITLEDKLGSAYEPIIFAALNSSKVMLSIGTKPEYFNAVWVKNEWSRFLKMMKSNRSKMLIPCYKGMDAYELPEEFAHLQAQDMGKIGFINDIVRGIKKVIVKDETKTTTTVVKETVVQGANANTASLIKRAFMFLEDSKWSEANAYCEKVLDIDPESVEAYLGKLLAELKVSTKTNLEFYSEPFDKLDNYAKIMRFGNEELINELKQYNLTIRRRNLENYNEGIYNAGIELAKQQTPEKQLEAAKKFEKIMRYRDAAEKAKECREKIATLQEIIRKDEILSSAKAKIEDNTIASYEEAIELLSTIKGWKDADTLVIESQTKIEELTAKAELDRLEKERQEEILRQQAEARAKLIKKIAIITTPIVCAIIVFIIVLNFVIIPNVKYNDAVALMDAGNLDEAYNIVKELGNFKDSDSISEELKAKILKNAEDLYYAGDAQAAADLLSRCSIDDSGYYEVAQGNYKAAVNKGLTNIVIPSSVTHIDDDAFSGCTSLKSITIPDSVTKIGTSAFKGCTSLTSIKIPNSVTEIGISAFEGCTRLTSITIPNKVSVIKGGTFSGCTGLERITIPDSVTEIYSAFKGCTRLTSITIPDSVTKIGSSAFEGCERLTSITIPDSVTEIGLSAFRGCTWLKSITIPDSVTKIGSYAFSGCTGLTSITIPNSVTEIDSFAFEDCTRLTSITIPDSVTEISIATFKGCTELTSITIPDSVTEIGPSAFKGCTNLNSVVFEKVAEWRLYDSVFEDVWYKHKLKDQLTTPSSAVRYLTTTYCEYYWRRY